jgi:DNA-binding transcriptional ArsR family regulator
MSSTIEADVKLLQAAADPTRLAILRQLSSDGPTCACDVVDGGSGLSQPTISHHLRVLRESGWIEGERRGTWIWYSIREEALERFQGIASGIRLGGARPTGTLGGPRARRGLDVIQPEWRQW